MFKVHDFHDLAKFAKFSLCECSSPKRDKVNQILTMKSLILTEIVKLSFAKFSHYTVRNSKKDDFV